MKRWWNYYGGLVMGLTVTFVILAAIVIGSTFTYGHFERKACREKVDALGQDYRWGYFSGCLVRDGDRWVPLPNWRRSENTEVAP